MPLSNRLDILIFGASGYTGQYVVEEMARKGIQFGFKWGIAGRTADKLKQVLQHASKNTGIENLSSNADTIIANITNKQSLVDMCARTKVLVNCVGPYRLYGEPVVQACLEARTHYVDLSGEPQFLETMQLRYDKEAAEREVAIVGSCGIDSLAADLCVETIRQECEQKDLDIASIESFLQPKLGKTSGSIFNYATWESAVYGLSHANELKHLRRQLFQQKLPYSKNKINRRLVFKTIIDGEPVWVVPFPGSDKSVVQRTQYFNYTQLNKKPVFFQAYLPMSSLISVAKFFIFGFVFSLFTKSKFGIQCLLKFPRLFSAGLMSKEAPTRADLKQASFKMTFVTYTEDNQKLIHEFTGPDPRYLGASTMAIGCAIMLLKEYDRLPVKGGVLTPGAAFGRTILMDYLEKEGMSFIQKFNNTGDMSSSTRLDAVIFGASGYTGQYVVEEMARKGKEYGFKWGIAGRTADKLKQILRQASDITGIENLDSSVDIIIANITNKQSLVDMCARTKVLVNCVGPYRLYGEPVVQACLEARTHHVDISGEPQFLETMQLRYNQEAAERGVAIVGSCGFDSVIADLGVETIRQECEQKNLDIALIESFLQMKSPKATSGLCHYGTWESAVYGLAHANELKPLRRQLFPQKLPYPKNKFNRRPVFKATVNGESVWAVPFPGSDKSVVQRTQYFNHTQLNRKPVRYQPYLQMSSLIYVVLLAFFGLIFGLFTKFKFGIQCLLKYPGVFSAGVVTHEGATRAQCEQSWFKTTFITHTEDNKKLIHEFTGRDPGYGGTAKMLIACAVMLLKESDRLPVKGGVLTPGAAFGSTTLVDYLRKEEISLTQK